MRQVFTGLVLVAAMVAGRPLVAAEIEIELAQQRYRIELASSPEQRRRGLMFRRNLEPRSGMLLVYSNSGDHRIWMKNMHIPLMVYWIDEQLTVVDAQRLSPCSADPCPTFGAARPSRFVLELDDGPHPLKAGDRIEALRSLL